MSDDTAPVRFAKLVELEQNRGSDLRSAVATIRQRYRELCDEVLEIVGLWPSSERDFRELQRQHFQSLRQR